MEIILKYFSHFTQAQLNQFFDLEKLYKSWNDKINVISRKDIESLYEKHVLHSLSIAAVFDFADGTDIIDIGTGGGFPGIPLAIFFPRVKFHLVDSIGKKLKVVEAIANEIGLKNITTEHIRAEEIKNTHQGDTAGRGKFDFAVSRAVAPLKDLWKWSIPLLNSSEFRVQGQSKLLGPDAKPLIQNSELTTLNPGLICLKGGDLAKEIEESGKTPHQIEIFELFPEEYFKGKYLLHVSE